MPGDQNECDKQFSIQPVPGAEKHQGSFDPKFAAHLANPGPVISNNLGNVPFEGTKEQRQERMAKLNKK